MGIVLYSFTQFLLIYAVRRHLLHGQKPADKCSLLHVCLVLTHRTSVYLNSLYPLEITQPLLPLVQILKHFTTKINKNYLRLHKKAEKKYYFPKQLASLVEAMKLTRQNLQKVKIPTFALQAFNDKLVPFSCPSYIGKHIGSDYKKVAYYSISEEDSNQHQLIAHKETERIIFKDILSFLEELELENVF